MTVYRAVLSLSIRRCLKTSLFCSANCHLRFKQDGQALEAAAHQENLSQLAANKLCLLRDIEMFERKPALANLSVRALSFTGRCVSAKCAEAMIGRGRNESERTKD